MVKVSYIVEAIATAHSSSISVFEFKCYVCACVHGNTRMFARCTKAYFMLLRYNGKNIKCCLAHAFTKRVNAVRITHSSTCTDVLAAL